MDIGKKTKKAKTAKKATPAKKAKGKKKATKEQVRDALCINVMMLTGIVTGLG